MSKSIDTLVSDIYSLFEKPVPAASLVAAKDVEDLGKEIAESVVKALGEDDYEPSLRFSNIGTPCQRKLWYSIRSPQLGEKLPAYVRIKFLFGHILESLLLFLSKAAGHDVRGRQDELSIAGIKGHRDAVIDNRTVDVKSATTASFKKFKDNGLREDDPFGYIDQINAYRYADKDSVDDKVSFLAIDKQLGHICLDTYEANQVDYAVKIAELKDMVAADEPPARSFEDQPEGKSGNRKLCTTCSYCPFKATCWPGLRTFVYANGPQYLTHVEKEPNVYEQRTELF